MQNPRFITNALVAAAVIGMLPLAASRLGATTQFTPDQTDRDIRALEEQVALLRAKVAELENSNRLLKGEMQGVNARLAQFDTAIGGQAQSFTVGNARSGSVTIRSVNPGAGGAFFDNRTVIVQADKLLLRGKAITIEAQNSLDLSAPVVDIGGGKVNVKGSSDLITKGSKLREGN